MFHIQYFEIDFNMPLFSMYNLQVRKKKTVFIIEYEDRLWVLLITLKAVLKSKLATFWHIYEATFYRKHIKFVGTLIFTIENRLVLFVFQ